MSLELEVDLVAGEVAPSGSADALADPEIIARGIATALERLVDQASAAAA